MSGLAPVIAQAGIRFPFDQPPAPGAVTRVAPGILWARLPLPMALDHVNVYALDDGDGWTVIDTGFASKKARAEWLALMAGPLGGRPIKRVVLPVGCSPNMAPNWSPRAPHGCSRGC